MKKWALTFALVLVAFWATAQSGEAPKIKVFPNPATNVVNVLGVKNTQKAQITISNMYGNVVLTHEWEVRNNALNIPISNLDSGIYMIVISSEEQQLRTKFLKQ